MKTSLLLICIMLTLYSNAQEWTHIGQSADGAVQIFLKESSVKNESGYFSCRVKTTTSPNYEINLRLSREKSVVGYENYNHSLYIYLIDCKMQRYILRKRTDFTSSGNLLDDVTPSDAEVRWMNILPNTVAKAIVDKICVKK
jgi:Surface-adhesin protein E